MKKALCSVLACALILLCVGCGSDSAPAPSAPAVSSVPAASSEAEPEEPTKEDTINDLVAGYNDSAPEPLIFVEDFAAQDKSSGHYRTEFRLHTFNDAIGKSYTCGELTVDIVAYSNIPGNADLRIYTAGASLEQCLTLIEFASPLMDPEMTPSVLTDALNDLSARQEANGYYYGNLGLVMSNHYKAGYELMLKKE